MYKIFIATKTFEGGVHTLIVESSTKEEADLIFEKIKDESEKTTFTIRPVKLY